MATGRDDPQPQVRLGRAGSFEVERDPDEGECSAHEVHGDDRCDES